MTEETVDQIDAQDTTPVPVENPQPAPEEPVIVKPVKRKKTLSFTAIFSLIAGIATFGWFFTMVGIKPLITYFTAPLLALIAIIFGYRSKYEIRKSAADMKGRHIANYGLMLGYLFILFAIFVTILVLMGVMSLAGLPSTYFTAPVLSAT